MQENFLCYEWGIKDDSDKDTEEGCRASMKLAKDYISGGHQIIEP